MITLKITLLLAISLLAPLHGAGDAPAHGGAGGEYSAAPAASTRRGAHSASEVMVENHLLRMCNKKQKTLETQFPGILTGAIPSEPQPITEAQLTALNDARLEIVDATNNINEGGS